MKNKNGECTTILRPLSSLKKIKTLLKANKFMKKKLIEGISLDRGKVRKIWMTMRLIVFLFFVSLIHVSASVYSQKTKLNIKLENATLQQVFSTIQEQTEFDFFYKNEQIPAEARISIQYQNEAIDVILDKVLSGTGLTYHVMDKDIVISINGATKREMNLQQQKSISGKVTDSSGGSLPGVSVIVKGTTTGTITDANGSYSLSGIPANATLQFSFVGMKTQEVTIGSKTTINVSLAEETVGIEEVVAVGYGVQKKKLVTGSTIQVKGESLQKLSTVSTLNALQSQTPGLSITSTSGRPDADYKINIRGLGTINNANPLVVINGIAGGDLKTLAPSDIESIDVLKDAASAAIYGSRAANGVILVTTKQGKAGKSSVSLDTYYGIQNVEKYMSMCNAQDYMTLVNEATVNSTGKPIDFSTALPANIWSKLQGGWTGTDWMKELSNPNAPVQNHSLNITSGTDMSTYSIGMSYTNQEAIMGNPLKESLERYSFRLNSDHVLLKRNNRNIITFGENLLYTYKKNENRMYLIGRDHPLLPVKDENGNYSPNISWDPDRSNPVAMEYYNSQNESKNHDFRFNAYFEVKPVKDLTFKSNMGYSLTAYSSRSYAPTFYLGTSSYRSIDQTSQGSTIGVGYQMENTLTYNLKIKGAHNIVALVGQSIEQTGLGESLSGNNSGSIFNSFEYAYLSNVKTITPGQTGLSGSYLGKWSMASFFGRINYDYKETYLFTALIRRDGSSRFASGNRWGNFPSVSAGWVVSNEPFLQSTKSWLDFFKLRASWGQNGNQEIPSFQYLSPISFSNANYYFGTSKSNYVVGAYPSMIPNENITWETSEQLDFGFDSRLLGGRMMLAMDVYNKKTKDWLVNAPILGSQGAGAPYINGGDVTNKGIELSLNWNDKIGEFTYGISANYAYNTNKITRIANPQGLIDGIGISAQSSGQLPPYRAQVGYPIGYFWGFKTAGVFQNQAEIDAYKGAKVGNKPGDLIFVDLNNDGAIDAKDRTKIGDPNPKGIFGFSINLGYKGFDFSATASGVSGNQIMTAYHMGDKYKESYPTYLMDRWHGEGTSNRYPRLTSTASPNYNYFSDIYINDGDYLRIQNVTLGYNLKKLFPAMPINQARLYIAVQNLYTFTNYIGPNPEVGAAPSDWAKGIDIGQNMPLSRTFMIGANLKF